MLLFFVQAFFGLVLIKSYFFLQNLHLGPSLVTSFPSSVDYFFNLHVLLLFASVRITLLSAAHDYVCFYELEYIYFI